MDCTIFNHNLQATARRVPSTEDMPTMDVLYIKDEKTRSEIAIVDIDERLAMRIRKALDTLYPPREALGEVEGETTLV